MENHRTIVEGNKNDKYSPRIKEIRDMVIMVLNTLSHRGLKLADDMLDVEELINLLENKHFHHADVQAQASNIKHWLERATTDVVLADDALDARNALDAYEKLNQVMPPVCSDM